MSTLDDLFGEAGHTASPGPGIDPRERERLRRLVGAGAAGAARPAGSTQGRASLADIVGEAGAAAPGPQRQASAAPVPDKSAARPRRQRSRRRTPADWVNALVATVAVAAVVGVGALVLVERTTQDDVAQAAQSLRQQEAEVRNRATTLQTSQGLYSTAITDAAALAAEADAALVGLEGKSDEAARATAVQALDAFGSALAGHQAADDAVELGRATPEPTDLASVAAALDDVREASEAIDEAIDRTREARSALTAAQDAFRAALATFGATLPASAAEVVDENLAAVESYREAVRVTADDVGVAQGRGESGLAQMVLYGQAVDALRAENQRVLDLRSQIRRDSWTPPQVVEPPPPVEEESVPPPPEGEVTEPGTDPGIIPGPPIQPVPTDPPS
ncbi:hypothetical protein [Microbacterium sp. NPDC055455]